MGLDCGSVENCRKPTHHFLQERRTNGSTSRRGVGGAKTDAAQAEFMAANPDGVVFAETLRRRRRRRHSQERTSAASHVRLDRTVRRALQLRGPGRSHHRGHEGAVRVLGLPYSVALLVGRSAGHAASWQDQGNGDSEQLRSQPWSRDLHEQLLDIRDEEIGCYCECCKCQVIVYCSP